MEKFPQATKTALSLFLTLLLVGEFFYVELKPVEVEAAYVTTQVILSTVGVLEWNVPDDWTDEGSLIEAIGGGGGGSESGGRFIRVFSGFNLRILNGFLKLVGS